MSSTHSLMGFAVSASQDLGRSVVVSGGYGYGGVLTVDGGEIASSDPAAIRDKIRASGRNWAAASVAATIPGSATKVAASYMFADYSTLMPAHRSLTQRFTPDTGLNLRIRQPIPSFGILPGRFEAHAELRNMLAQGYLPLTFVDGRRIWLMQNARAIRGGFSFIF